MLRMIEGTDIGTKGRSENRFSVMQTLKKMKETAAPTMKNRIFNTILMIDFFLFPLKSMDKELDNSIDKRIQNDFHST